MEMQPSNCDAVHQSCSRASQYVHTEEWGAAVQLFLEALTTQPERCTQSDSACVDAFIDDLCAAASQFCAQLPQSQALWVAAKVCEHCAESRLQHLYSRLLCEAGMAHKAVAVLRSHAEHVHSGTNALVLESFENAKNLCVDRWHFRMLNDRMRNEAYDRAIRVAVQRIGTGCTVLDIGGGTGLLSMMAIRAGAAHAFCCEMNPAMCAIAEQCIHANGFADSVTVLCMHSSQLTAATLLHHLPERLRLQHLQQQNESEDELGKVNLIVTELMDSGLLGEHMISAIRHAATHLLREGGVVIPHSAAVVGQLIESHEIRQRKLFDPSQPTLHDDQPLKTFYRREGLKFVVDEAYTCEALRNLPHTPLTNPFELLRVDFLQVALCGTSEHRTGTFIVAHSGRIDALAYWFTVRMLPYEDIYFDTHPSREGCGWDQAILFLGDAPVQQGLTILVDSQHNDDQIEVAVVDEQTGEVLCSSDTLRPSNGSANIEEVGEMDIALLNDMIRSNAYTRAIERTLCDLGRSASGPQRIVELVGNWTPHTTALLSQQLEQGDGAGFGELEVVSVALSEESAAISQRCTPPALQANVFHRAGHVMDIVDAPGVVVNVCVADVVEGCGMIRQQCLEELYFIREFLTANTLPSRALICIPHQLQIVVQLAECPSLHFQHHVNDANTVGIDISTSINQFGTCQLRELDLGHTHDLKWLSEPREVASITLRDFEAEPLLLGLATPISLPVLSEGNVHAICYWFRLGMLEDEDGPFLDTGPHNEHWQHWRQAAFLLPCERVSPGQTLDFDLFWNRMTGIWLSSR